MKFSRNKKGDENVRTRKKILRTQEEVNEDVKRWLMDNFKETKWIPHENDINHVLQEIVTEEAPRVVCYKCKYTWTPNPRMWKQDPVDTHLTEYDGDLVKPIRCPSCNNVNKLDLKTMLWIMDWWKRYSMQEIAIKKEAKEFRNMVLGQVEGK